MRATSKGFVGTEGLAVALLYIFEVSAPPEIPISLGLRPQTCVEKIDRITALSAFLMRFAAPTSDQRPLAGLRSKQKKEALR